MTESTLFSARWELCSLDLEEKLPEQLLTSRGRMRQMMQNWFSGSRLNLQQAMVLLIQNQAAFVAQLAETNKSLAQADLRFARIERQIEEIKAIVDRLSQLHEAIAQLPEAIQQKIGFKSK